MEERFYFCETCGNLLFAAIASGVIPYCCGDQMTLLQPNTTDGKHEKHLPVCTVSSGNCMTIRIGAEPHPMSAEHNIRFVCLETDCEIIVHYLEVDGPAETCIRFSGQPRAVYAYCNLHGLWRTDIQVVSEV